VEHPDGRQLAAALEEARVAGLLGPGPIDAQLRHAAALVALLGPAPAGPVLDLGSGGGLPGLPLALTWPATEVVLLDRRARAARHLRDAISELALGPRVRVVEQPAEAAARDHDLRGHFDLVIARGFGPPAVTAECAVGFLRAGGHLAVSEPTGVDAATRWPPAQLAELGLTPAELRRASEATLAMLTLEHRVDDRWPRRALAKRPLW
jgi:16S rRNA (guanine527-N7)-methyltransferase